MTRTHVRSGSVAAPAGKAVRAAAAAAAAGAVTRLVRGQLGRALGAGDPRWTRTNHRGEPVSLLEGPALAVGLAAGAALAGDRRAAGAGLLAVVGGAAFGLVDDLAPDAGRNRKGLRGHLGALAHGEVTTGGLKVLGIGTASLLAAAVALPRPRAAGAGQGLLWSLDVATAGALVASSANLVNLLDLRPGRALKGAMLGALLALAGAGAPAAAACLGAATAALGPDLGERDMLGDAGANALGALVGTAVVLGAPRPARLALLAGTVALTLASERISFTAVIARTPVLRELDGWGRRPAADAGDSAP